MVVINSKLIRFHANDLLDHRVIQSGHFEPSPIVSSVEDSILEIVDMMNWTLGHRNLKIDFIRQSIEARRLYFDKRRLQQVLLNLLSNAIKFSSEGTISVTVDVIATNVDERDSNEGSIKVQVLDNGIGMSLDD